MIKHGLKNYLSGLKFIFVPLGVMFVGVLFGVSVFFNSVFGAINEFTEGVEELTGESTDVAEVGQGLWNAVKDIGWNKPLTAVSEMYGEEWFGRALIESAYKEEYADEIQRLAFDNSSAFKKGMTAFVAFFGLGFLASFLLTKFFIRKKIAERTFIQSLLYTLLNAILTTAVTALTVWLSAIWVATTVISVVLTAILSGCVALIEAYLIFGRKKIKFSEAVSGKNVFSFILCNMIIFAISSGVTVLAVLINTLVGIFIGLSLLIISTAVIGMNAESYVMELSKDYKVTDSV